MFAALGFFPMHIRRKDSQKRDNRVKQFRQGSHILFEREASDSSPDDRLVKSSINSAGWAPDCQYA